MGTRPDDEVVERVVATPPAEPHERLAAAVIGQAIEDARNARLRHEVRVQVQRWIEQSGDFAFWCSMARLDPVAVRERLVARGWAPLPVGDETRVDDAEPTAATSDVQAGDQSGAPASQGEPPGVGWSDR